MIDQLKEEITRKVKENIRMKDQIRNLDDFCLQRKEQIVELEEK